MFKANDIRGIVGGDAAEWDGVGARAIGAAYVELMNLAGEGFVLGRDMRVSGPEMSAAFADGARGAGADVIDAGLSSTDQLWFDSGSMDLPGVQFTASHNPPEYNGIKFCLPGAQPVTSDFIIRLADRADEILASGALPQAGRQGTLSQVDTLDEYAQYLRSLVNTANLRPLKVVVDAGNGMAGHTTRAVLEPLGVEIVGLYLDLDGNFPNHQPNPLIPENLVDASKAVVEHGADLALVFDGDADRCFIIDERGEVVTPSVVTALIAKAELTREPGSTIVRNLITSDTVAEVVEENGGKLVTSKVGHTMIKALMAEHDAIFGGEHSAHYYFRDFWGADTGMLAALHVLALLGHQDRPLSELVTEFDRYAASGEINFTVADKPAAMEAVASALRAKAAEEQWVDGLKLLGEGTRGTWWVSVRPSNTEPLLRLNVEAKDPQMMAALRDDVSDILAGFSS